ncbi:MAG: phage Gp37/Gp68 family protein [Chloroflexi bacterium]|nr:phage Gp37/Gp68 family protein [Chloroflexota bacterium]
MAANSAIEWTNSTWNPLTGCTKISPGCSNCYAERMAARLRAMGQPNYANGFQLTLHEHALSMPLRWKKAQNIFVNSMSDLFHRDVPAQFILQVFEVMAKAHWHRFQVLTKRSSRLLKLSSDLSWQTNIWMGVSVESREYKFRIDHLRDTQACVKFLSIEPLLGPLGYLDLKGIDWVIVGGESGPRARPLQSAWVVDIREQCNEARVPFFFKQWGGRNKKKTGRHLEGRTWDQMPAYTVDHRAHQSLGARRYPLRREEE